MELTNARPMTSRTHRIHQLLHTLWTKAVGSSTYAKNEWTELQRLLMEEVEFFPFLPDHILTPSDGYSLDDFKRELEATQDDPPTPVLPMQPLRLEAPTHREDDATWPATPRRSTPHREDEPPATPPSRSEPS